MNKILFKIIWIELNKLHILYNTADGSQKLYILSSVLMSHDPFSYETTQLYSKDIYERI